MQRNFVFVPGAWHAGWAWWPVARRVRAAGHEAVTLTLPGQGDGDDTVSVQPVDAVNHIVDEIVRRDLTDVTLVAHSMGGFPVTAASAKLEDRLTKIVYVNAFVPTPGRTEFDELDPNMQKICREVLDSSPDASWSLGIDFVKYGLMQGQPDEMQQMVTDLLTPMPRNYLLKLFDIPDVTSLNVDLAYLLGEDDIALPRPGSEFAARIGLQPTMIPGPHNALLTHPDEVAKAVVAA
jgi:pimeloyl-ACP methyl ester carboxylesterase